MGNRFVVIAVGVLLGASLGGIARRTQPTRTPILQGEKHDRSSRNHGSDPLVTVELEPSAVLKDSAGERLEYQLSVVPRAEVKSNVTLQYSVELVGDDGAQLQAPRLASAISLAPNSGHSAQVTTPPSARNGYSVIRTQVAASDGTEDTLQIAESYFKVTDGTMLPVSADEYFQNSNARLARRTP